MKREIFAVFAIALAFNFGGAFHASADGFGMYEEGFGFGHMFFGGAMMIAFWGAVIVLVVFAVRWISASQTRARDDASAQSSSLRILEERYARGDLDHDEFERRRQVLLRPGTTV